MAYPSLNLGLAEPLTWDPANPEWPAEIPNLLHCQYVCFDAFQSGGFLRRESGDVFTDDEIHELFLASRRKNQGVRLFAMPLSHMAYNQALSIQAQRCLDGGASVVEIDRARCVVTTDLFPSRPGFVVAVRLAWLQTPSLPGHTYGSANWTPERGRELAETLAEVERLNPVLVQRGAR